LASPSRQLAGNPLAGRLEDQQGTITLVICANLDGSEKIPLTIIGKHFKSMLFQGYQLQYVGHPLSRQCKSVDDPERLLTLVAGL
jgi:hypothetical protein